MSTIDTFMYLNQALEAYIVKYATGDPGIRIRTTEHEPYMSLTTNLPDELREFDYAVAINQDPLYRDIATILERANVIVPTGQMAYSGFNAYDVYSLCDEAIETFDNAEL